MQAVLSTLAFVALGVCSYLGYTDPAITAWLAVAAAWLFPQPSELAGKLAGTVKGARQ